MTDRPIIFSAPMVLALLEGRKTQTRRLVSPATCEFGSISPGKYTKLYWEHADWSTKRTDRGFPDPADGIYRSGYLHVPCHDEDEDEQPKHCAVCQERGWAGTAHRLYPRVQARDLLWVKETWQTGNTDDGPRITFKATPDYFDIDAWNGPDEGIGPSFNYDKCPGATWHTWLSDLLSEVDGSWRSPLHMPRWASRITLGVDAVRIARLHDITEDDARSEGFGPHANPGTWTPHRASFAEFWCKLHRQTDWWVANPFVVVISFSVHNCNIDAMPAQRRAA